MTIPSDPQPCDFCKLGHVVRGSQPVEIRQLTDRGLISCHAVVPLGICNYCGSKTLDEPAEKIIEQAIQQEYKMLR
jgi:hypothetical protein